MHNEDNKILKYNHGEKSMKHPFIIYIDLKSLLEKTSPYHNNSKKYSTNIKRSINVIEGKTVFKDFVRA